MSRDVNEIEKSLETQILIAPDLEITPAEAAPSDRYSVAPRITCHRKSHHLSIPTPPTKTPSALLTATGMNSPNRWQVTGLIGTPEMVRDRIAAYQAEGIQPLHALVHGRP